MYSTITIGTEKNDFQGERNTIRKTNNTGFSFFYHVSWTVYNILKYKYM